MAFFSGLANIGRKSLFVVLVIFVTIFSLDVATRLMGSTTESDLVTHHRTPQAQPKYPRQKPPLVASTTSTTAAATTTTALPGLQSMDLDLKLPPEVPKRPNSKEIILNYSQRRDYAPTIQHNDMCGGGTPKALDLNDFDYSKDVFLLAVVKSSCSMSARRSAIRRTWGNVTWVKNELGVIVRLVFLLGACQDKKQSNDLIAEDKVHRDILQWDFFDSFRNLTLKDCLFMQWYTRYCRNVPFVFKGDDDVFVNLRNIVSYVKDTPSASRENLFVGSVLNGSPRILDPTWKYYVSYNLYPEKLYPPYVSGGGFIMGGRLVVKLFQASLQTRIIPIDDAFLGILLKKIGVSPKNDRGFKSWGMKKKDPCRLSKIKTYHKMLPDQLLKAWDELMKADLSKCGKDSDDVLRSQTKRAILL